MSDIVVRLRATGGKGQCGPLKAEAADEIERLRVVIERVADLSEKWEDSLVRQINDISRAALKGE